MNSRDLRARAWGKLSGNWGTPIAVVLVYALIVGGINSLGQQIPLLSLASIIVAGPLLVGIAGFFTQFARGAKPAFESLFDGFKKCFGNSIVLSLLTGLFVLLWALLFIIPGIIKAIAYSMAPYLMADNPNMTATEALDDSQRLMDGHKMDFFILGLSFIGWALLVIVTFGIAAIWVGPYIQATHAEFYLELVGNNGELDAEIIEKPESEDSFDSFLK